MALFKPIVIMAGAALIAGTIFSVAGCGDDDDNPGNPDTGTDAPVGPDQNNPPVDGGNDVRTDGGDGGCNFTQFVIDLVNANTNNTAKPSTDLGDNCTDNQAPFPATFFQ